MLFRIRIHYSSIRVTIADLADFRREKHFWPEYTLTNVGKDVKTVVSKIVQAKEIPKTAQIFEAVLNPGIKKVIQEAEGIPKTATELKRLLEAAREKGNIREEDMPETDAAFRTVYLPTMHPE